jgi:very-long-chain (3R)-3-hydroxyacyl-CoA dehydratase
MIFAWSLTEVIRYTFYATSVLGITLPGLNWLRYVVSSYRFSHTHPLSPLTPRLHSPNVRYTTFLPLYPLGASSEAFLSFSTLPPLSKLPGLPDGLKAFSPLSTVFKYLPPSVGYSIMKSEWGRTLLWNAASKSAQTKVGIVTEKEWGVLEIARLFFFVTWWPGTCGRRFLTSLSTRCLKRPDRLTAALYVLYTHMLGQRKKVLGKGRTLKSKTA